MAVDQEYYTKFIHNITGNLSDDEEGNEFLHFVARTDNNAPFFLDKVIKYLQQWPHVINSKNKNGRTPLHIAAKGTNCDLIKIFLDYGASVNIVDGNHLSPFHIATVKGYKKIIEMMLDRNVDVHLQTGRGQTALHLAVLHKNCIMAEILLDRGANVNEQDDHGATPLSMAVQLGDLTMVELLLERGGNINIMDNRERSPLHLAAGNWDYRVAKLLMDRGVLLNTQDADRKTPLHVAIENKDLSMVDKLLLRGVLTDGLDNERGTPLVYAVRAEFPLIVQKLIVQGATVEALYDCVDGLNCLRDKTVQSHMVKLYVANMISKEQFSVPSDYSELVERCREELEQMRNNKFKNVNLCDVFKFKLQPENHVQFSEALCSPELDNQFPLYSVVLKATFLKAKQRSVLLRKCRSFFTIIQTFKFKVVAKLNIETKDAILNHLSNMELHNLLIYCENILRDELVRPHIKMTQDPTKERPRNLSKYSLLNGTKKELPETPTDTDFVQNK